MIGLLPAEAGMLRPGEQIFRPTTTQSTCHSHRYIVALRARFPHLPPRNGPLTDIHREVDLRCPQNFRENDLESRLLLRGSVGPKLRPTRLPISLHGNDGVSRNLANASRYGLRSKRGKTRNFAGSEYTSAAIPTNQPSQLSNAPHRLADAATATSSAASALYPRELAGGNAVQSVQWELSDIAARLPSPSHPAFDNRSHNHDIVSPAAAVAPVPIKMSPSTRTTPSSSTSSPPARRNSAPRKSPTAKATKPVIRRTSNGKKDTEKRVGRRRGPLLPEQRKQASEIRKLRACLRCKFLKKTCDKGEPCTGCQPSHARLWQVPCTRIDIKDIGYFMKDWRADYERHVGRGVSVYNIKGFGPKEELIWITHGYGFAIPIMAREVYVTDDSCFQVDWVETGDHDEPLEFDTRTERMSAGSEGISTEALSEYLDKHLDGPFEEFVDEYFEGTPFITEILKTAHRYYMKEKVSVVRKALKLVLAYNLTLHVTMVEQRGDEHPMEGIIDDEDSRFNGKIIAPVMINFQIKCALADMWRELQKEILEELSSLYSSVYSGDRLKNWPTIFMLASILLAVWEEMQFDCHYRVPDTAAVNKFCNDMETTPVGVIVGLFHAISQKLPSFTEWETRRHGQLLNNNVAVCEAMTEMREHVTKHEDYLKTRPDSKFDRRDFDSLSNKFLSKLVIRAN
ncbi:hypothetical protein M7I_2378 [Glarea lozoyensis 74030]|uniref:C6 finger domain-containing protein n=1 Tax=Glarea lozoyensis (strain ATCC 74030 / MF5533) TaxID=1104152 RepID=H0EIL8_GLAL7|nr:hypothetical protein M7I_2378 [Glarea lozoyensis 74030]